MEVLKRERDARLTLLCRNQIGKLACRLAVTDASLDVDSAPFYGLFSHAMGEELTRFVNHFDTVVCVGFSEVLEECLTRHHRGKTVRIPPRPPADRAVHVARYLTGELQKAGLLQPPDGFVSRETHAGQPLDRGPSARGNDNLTRHACQKNVLLVHPGAGSPRKRWPVERFMDLASAIADGGLAEVVFLVGPAERDLLSPLTREATRWGGRVDPVQDLGKVLDRLQGAACFVGNDSGLTHLAAYGRTPTVAVFGPTDPNRWAPLGRSVKVLRGQCPSAACFETATDNCLTPRCLSDVSVGAVLAAVKDLCPSIYRL
jgi:heptosyltransferase-3